MSFSATRSWFNYCCLLIFFFVVKGIIYLCIMPPFEGWDEYQHLAYITHLQIHSDRPVLNKTTVPRELLQDIVYYPVSDSMLEQTKETGSLDYKTYFSGDDTPTYNDQHGDINFYQAQHGELYYRLMLPVLNILPDDISILSKVCLLRSVNFGLITLSLISILWLVQHIVHDRKYAALLGLLIISQPLLLINSIRISNDALAIMIGTWVVIIGLLPKLRSNLFFVLLAGLLLGLSCWAKTTSFVLLPFWACCLGISWYQKEISFKKLVVMLFLSFLIALAILFKYFLFNLENYGMLFVMQEALINKANNIGISDITKAVMNSEVFSDIFKLWTKKSIWVGGWSMLQVTGVRNIYLILVSISLFSWIYRTISSKKIEPIVQTQSSLLCFLLCLLTSLSIGWHYIQCIIAWGVDGATSCPWYLCASLPFFLIFIFDSASRWSARTCVALMLALISLYLYADIRGSMAMMSYYSGGARGVEALGRLATIHPVGLGTQTLVISTALFAGLIVYLMTTQVKLLFWKKET